MTVGDLRVTLEKYPDWMPLVDENYTQYFGVVWDPDKLSSIGCLKIIFRDEVVVNEGKN